MGGYSEFLLGFNSVTNMARTPRQKRAIATADAIIEAGFLCVAQHGVAGTTTNHIADMAGIGVGSLYEYYRSKEDVYAAMQERMVADAVAVVGPVMNEVVRLDIREAVKTLLRHFEVFLQDNDSRYLRYAQSALSVNLRLQLEPLVKLLQELVMRYAMQHPEYLRMPHIATMSYIMINGGIFIVLRHLSDPNPPVSFDELIEGLANMVSHYANNEMALAAGDARSAE